MPAWTFYQCTCGLRCFHHYIFHLLPMFIYIKVFPLCFSYLIFDHALVFFMCIFLLELPYTYSWFKLTCILLLLQPFYGSLYYIWDNPGEPVPEGTFRHFLDFLVQNEGNTGRYSNNPDGLPPHPHLLVPLPLLSPPFYARCPS